MVQFDNQSRKIKLKIVYYGPALGGKTTTLEFIHRVIDADRKTRLYSLNTANDRTLFFDLMTLDLGSIRGYGLTAQLFTVPGQVQYNATRRAVLAGVDAIVLVADSRQDQLDANMDSMRNLGENLKANGIDPQLIPMVFQFNKQDLAPLTPPDLLNAEINPREAPFFLTTATTGSGVMESFATITELTVNSVVDRLGLGARSRALERLQKRLRRTLQPFQAGTGYGPVTATGPIDPRVEITTDLSSDSPLSQQELMEEAVRANLKMTDLNCSLDATRIRLNTKIEAMESIANFSQDISKLNDPREILQSLLESACGHLNAHGGAILLFSGGSLRKFKCRGFETDPLMAKGVDEDTTLADHLSLGKNPELIVVDSEDRPPNPFEQSVDDAGFTSALVLPLIEQGQIHGLLNLYRGSSGLPFDREDLDLGAVMATHACSAYSNAVNVSKIRTLNVTLEDQVRQRTNELKNSLNQVRSLNDDLLEKHAALELAYSELEDVDRLKNELLARISHELRTPISSLLTAASILSDGEKPPPDDVGIHFSRIIKSESKKLAEIIDGVIQASILASGPQQTKMAPNDVSQLVRSALEPLAETAASRNIDVKVSIPSGIDRLLCDRESMISAIRAVAKNAVLFNREGGSVLVNVVGGDALIISIKDTGTGIPEKDLPHIFEPFWQGGDLMTEKPAGVGLGLTIAKRIAEMHGGALSITNRNGEGAEAVFSLSGVC